MMNNCTYNEALCQECLSGLIIQSIDKKAGKIDFLLYQKLYDSSFHALFLHKPDQVKNGVLLLILPNPHCPTLTEVESVYVTFKAMNYLPHYNHFPTD